MVDFLSCQDKLKLQKVFIVHGQYEAQLTYKQTLENEGYSNLEIPEMGQEFEI